MSETWYPGAWAGRRPRRRDPRLADRAETLGRMLRQGGIQVTVVSPVAGAGAALAAVGPDLLVASPTSVDELPSVETIVGDARQLLSRRELPYLAVIGRRTRSRPRAPTTSSEPVDGRELLLRVRTILRGRAQRKLLHRKLEELQDSRGSPGPSRWPEARRRCSGSWPGTPPSSCAPRRVWCCSTTPSGTNSLPSNPGTASPPRRLRPCAIRSPRRAGAELRDQRSPGHLRGSP